MQAGGHRFDPGTLHLPKAPLARGVSFAGPTTLFRADPPLNPASFQRQAPEVYERLGKVLAAHGATTRVKHALRPLGVARARRDVVDPYKD